MSVCSGEALFADPDEEVRVIQRDEQIHEDAVFFVHVIIRGAFVKGLAVLKDEADALQIGHIGIVFGDSVIVHIKFATVVVALGIIAVAVDGIQALGAADHLVGVDGGIVVVGAVIRAVGAGGLGYVPLFVIVDGVVLIAGPTP